MPSVSTPLSLKRRAGTCSLKTKCYEAIEVCLRYPQFCNGWERSFVVSLAGQRRRLTQKQCARLAELVRKIARCAR
jgi:hypothetical protein